MATPGFSNTRGRWLVYAINISLGALFIYVSQLSKVSRAVNVHFDHVLDEGWTFPDAPHIALRRHYTGIGPLDTVLSFLVSAFLPAAAAFNPASFVQQLYFLVSFFPIISLMAIEASRPVNAGTLMSYTSLWALPYQTVGGAIFVPLWFSALVSATSRAQYAGHGVNIPSHVAKALLPALLVGYLLPTTLIYLPFWHIDTLQRLVAFWQPCPLYVNALVWLGSTLVPASSQTTERTSKHVRRIHLVTLLVTGVTHLGCIVACTFSTDPRLSITRVILPPGDDGLTMTGGLLAIFQADFTLIMASAIMWATVSGYSPANSASAGAQLTSQVVKVSVLTVALGPGAALAAAMYWREGRNEGARGGVSKKKS